MTTVNNRNVPHSHRKYRASRANRNIFPPLGKSEDLKGKDRKTGWDKASVIIQGFGALAIPIAIAGLLLGLYQFNAQQQTNNNTAVQQQQLTRQQEEAAQQQALDQQRQTTLDTYLDRMSDLLFTDKLAQSKRGDEVRGVAHARTLTALRNLDPYRKAILIQFLYESRLIQRPQPTDTVQNPIIDLTRADLSGADLHDTILEGADLSGADLQSAKLQGANLHAADLSGAGLQSAELQDAHLQDADLSGADLTGAILSYHCPSNNNNNDATCLVDLTIHRTDLRNASLRLAILRDADLSGADLRGADLSGADLTGAILDEADLTSADLDKATITQQQLDEVFSCKGGTLSKGLTCHHN